MKSKILLFFVAFITWCLLSWFPDWEHLVVGVFVSIFVAFITGDLFVKRPYILKHPYRYFYFVFYYMPIFLWECVKANIDVAYRVLHPRLPIRPGIVKVNVTLKSDTGLTFLANSITLTPGTMCVDIDKEKGVLYIHCINVKAADVEGATEAIIRKFENILKKVFE